MFGAVVASVLRSFRIARVYNSRFGALVYRSVFNLHLQNFKVECPLWLLNIGKLPDFVFFSGSHGAVFGVGAASIGNSPIALLND
jgi:hypothetical protein